MIKNILKRITSGEIKDTIIVILTLVIIGTIGYFLYKQSKDLSTLKNDLASTTASIDDRLAMLQSGLATTGNANQVLSQQIAAAQNESASINQTLSNVAGTVGTLQKLSTTDKELLQKYSKVYFLNENYIPSQLATIDQRYLYDQTKTLQFHAQALSFLTRMLDSANSNNVVIKVVSAYRSFSTQSNLNSSYNVTYGSGANKFSAEQGYSEHQLGTAVDLGTPYPDTLLMVSFDNTQAFNWLKNNAYLYGFILSYPKNNTYYQYEPWHWRFVGTQLATYLHNQNKNFYDLDQRVIDTYLVNIFD